MTAMEDQIQNLEDEVRYLRQSDGTSKDTMQGLRNEVLDLRSSASAAERDVEQLKRSVEALERLMGGDQIPP
jgi:chromosome segregation ATPase